MRWQPSRACVNSGVTMRAQCGALVQALAVASDRLLESGGPLEAMITQ